MPAFWSSCHPRHAIPGAVPDALSGVPPNKRVHAVGRSGHAGCIEPAARTGRNTIEWRPLAAGRNRRAPARPGGQARARR
jgi:hypothetical protein